MKGGLSKKARSYKMAADEGDAGGQFRYGWCLMQGEGVPRNLSEAARYFKMAADKGLAVARSIMEDVSRMVKVFHAI